MPSTLGRRPPDGGWGWVVLAAGFFSQMVGFGSPQSQGALYPEWLSVYAEGKSKTAWVGSLVFGSGPLLGPLWSACVLSRGPRWCVVVAGLILFCGYVLSAFAPNVSFLIVSYGFLVGVGGGLLYTASVSIICQYFDRRRGIALAIFTVGNSVGGIVYSSLQIFLVQVYGLEGCLLLVGAVSLHTVACGGLMRPLTPRRPPKPQFEIQRPESESRAGEPERGLTNQETASSQRGCGVRLRGVWQKLRSFAEFFPSMNVLQNRRLMALCVCLFLFCVGNVPYQLFIEDFAQSTGLDAGATEDSGEWVVSLVSLILMGNLSGKLILGMCADLPRVNSTWLYSATVALGGVCVICIPLSSSYLQLQFISFFLGIFGANWTLTALVVSRLVPVSQFDEAHGVLLLFGGVAVVAGPPVAGVFSDWLQSYDVAFFVSGACMISGSLVLFITLSLSCLRSGRELSSKAGPEQSSSPTLEPSQDQPQTWTDEP